MDLSTKKENFAMESLVYLMIFFSVVRGGGVS